MSFVRSGSGTARCIGFLASTLLLANCTSPGVVDAGPDVTGTDTGSPVDAASDTAVGDSADAMSALCPAVAPMCQDQQIQGLMLFDTVNAAQVTPIAENAGTFDSEIDATAGGMTPTRSFVYVRFTDTGLEKLEISDETAFTSLDWDIAVRRFVIRLNSGISGPSCVRAGRTAPGTMFDTLAQTPPALSFRTEEYFTPPTCELVPDGSGLGSPSTAISSFWTYMGCVQMTGNVYVVRLRSGRDVKLQVLSYYAPAVQQACDTTGMTTSPTGAGQVRIRWAFLPQ